MKTIRTAILYKDFNYNTMIKVWKLDKYIETNDDLYEEKSKESLLNLAFNQFGEDIKQMKFPEPLKGEFYYIIVETKEDEKFQITLGV